MAQYLVSSCLLGVACRYDGQSKPALAVVRQAERWRAEGHSVAAVCPEELAGFGTPRPAIELRGGDGHAVLAGQAQVRRCADGAEVTAALLGGARQAADAAPQAEVALLKANSPSCGCGLTEIDGRRQPGDGVFAALLRQRGCRVGTEGEVEPL